MNSIIKFSVKHPVSVLMIVLSFIICACISIKVISIDYLPKLNDRFLLINAEYSGMPAEQQKELVTKPIEDAAASIKGIKNISSVTRDGLSLVQVELHWNSDIDMALTESRQIIDQCYSILPTGCAKPNVKIFNPYEKETIKIVIIPKDENLEYGLYMTKNEFKPRFQRLQGIANVTINGGDVTEVQILPDKTKIESLGLSISQIAELITASNFEYPAGKIQEGNKEFVFKTDGLIKNLGDLRTLPVYNQNNSMLQLGDIAQIKMGVEDKWTYFSYMGKECISLSITKKSDASPIAVSKETKKLVDELNSYFSTDFEFIVINDLSVQLVDSIVQLLLSLAIGMLITVIILQLFFKNFSVSILVASIMPLSILCAILCLCLFDRSINIISLSGIAIGIGMVIDPSIVLIENVIKNLASKKEDIQETVYTSSVEVSLSSVSSTLTTVVVFIPFFFLPGFTGKLFSDLAIAVVASIGISCILSLTFIPAMLVLLFRKRMFVDKKGSAVIYAEETYKKILERVFTVKKLIPLFLILIFGVGVLFAKLLPIEVMPSTYSPNVQVELYLNENSSFDYLIENEKVINNYLKDNENFVWYTVTAGVPDNAYELLINPEIRTERLLIDCEVRNVKKASEFFDSLFAGKNIEYKLSTNKNILSEILNTNTNSVIVCGSDKNELKSQLLKYEVTDFYPDSVINEYVFEPDRKMCSRYNVSASQTAMIAKEVLDGVNAGTYYSDGRRIPMRIKYPKNFISTKEQLMESMIAISQYSIPVSTLGSFEYKQNERILYRYNRKDAKITNNFKLKKYNDENLLNPNKENLNELIQNALVLLVIVLILLYCVMGAQFESFSIPVFMMLALPPAFTGAFLFLLVFHQTLNINSIIALIVLFGTSVNNAIILYEVLSNGRAQNISEVISLCVSKLRSILITSLTSICAIIPFAIDPYHKNAQSSLSVAIIGGLLFSFIIVLTVVPSILNDFFVKKGSQNE